MEEDSQNYSTNVMFRGTPCISMKEKCVISPVRVSPETLPPVVE